MDKIWANRLIAGTQFWKDVPEARRAGVLAELQDRYRTGKLTAEKYTKITGEEIAEDVAEAESTEE